MTSFHRWFAGSFVLALSIAIASQAIGQPKTDGFRKIATLIQKGDKDGSRKAAEAYAKANPDVDLIMATLKPEGKKLLAMVKGKAFPAAAVEQMGYDIAAVGLITEFQAPMNPKIRNGWISIATDMTDAGIKLAAAVNSKNEKGIQAEVAKINTSCNSCHSKYR